MLVAEERDAINSQPAQNGVTNAELVVENPQKQQGGNDIGHQVGREHHPRSHEDWVNRCISTAMTNATTVWTPMLTTT